MRSGRRHRTGLPDRHKAPAEQYSASLLYLLNQKTGVHKGTINELTETLDGITAYGGMDYSTL